MWADVETKLDFLNYGELAEVIADMLSDPRMLPLSIGISGGWGVGKSTMLKLVEARLDVQGASIGGQTGLRTIVVNYDAWLYQGYDDARAALMESIASRLMTESDSKDDTVKGKAVGLFRRVNKLRVLGLLADGALLAHGVPTGGALSKGAAALGDLWRGTFDADDVSSLKEAGEEGKKRLDDVLRPEEKETPLREIEDFRKEFGELLGDLGAVLVVFIDNLDRCLPTQVIHTLEALRLFLFMNNTAFCVAADEDMVLT